MKKISNAIRSALEVPLGVLLTPSPIIWKAGALGLTIVLTTVIGMGKLIPAFNRFVDHATIYRQESMALALWIVFFGFIARRIEYEKFWRLLALTFLASAWSAFVFSIMAK